MQTISKNKKQRSLGFKVLTLTSLLVTFIIIAFLGFFFWAKSSTIEQSEYNALYQAPGMHNETQTDSVLVVATYNIGYLSGMTNNLPVRPTRDFYLNNEKRVMQALSELDADIIGFQEIDFDSHRSYHTNQAAMICDSLFGYGAFAVNWDKRYVPFPFLPLKVHFGKMLSGQAVMSKFPITGQQVHQLERVKSKPYFYRALYLDRLAQVVTINHPVKPIVVINLHAEAFDAQTRRRQLDIVYKLFWELEKNFSVILLGDFNSDPKVADAEISIFLNDSRLVSCAFDINNISLAPNTFPSDNPNERLDYIFFNSERFELIDSRITTEFGDISDHLPCVATLKIK
ncbi:MAG TPA: endonuclease/exonuclease/phosphatase family protein [Salinivirgaceae bacterium]|nr:endonuclease/exonuclease/phosphatase family protein [Salinivirgaceae bacterium]